MARGALRLYRSYVFRDKEPVIYDVRKLMESEGLSIGQLHTLSFVSDTTMRNWFYGETKRPQNASIEAVVRAMGYTRQFVKLKDVNYKKELEKAGDELLKRTKLKRKRNGK